MFKIIFTIHIEKREYSLYKKEKKLFMMLIFSQKSFENMLKSYLLLRLKKKKRKKREKIFTQKKTLFLMRIELGNQFELELWMNLSVTARELAVFSRLVLFIYLFLGLKTHFWYAK